MTESMPLVLEAEVRSRSIDVLSTKMYKTPAPANTLLMLRSRARPCGACRRERRTRRRARGIGVGAAAASGRRGCCVVSCTFIERLVARMMVPHFAVCGVEASDRKTDVNRLHEGTDFAACAPLMSPVISCS